MNFIADTHIKYFKNAFAELGFSEVKDFAVAQIADSTAMNPAIARKLGIQHVACCNHGLNLSCGELEKNDPVLKKLGQDTQNCHNAIRNSNKLTAALAYVQDSFYNLKLKATTCWISIYSLIASHLKAAPDIRVLVSDDKRNRVSGICPTIYSSFIGCYEPKQVCFYFT